MLKGALAHAASKFRIIETFVLQDDSQFKCTRSGGRTADVSLADREALVHGQTWYLRAPKPSSRS